MDMTLREGRQVAGVSVGLDEVLEFARRIDEVGVHIVEMHHDFIDEIKRTKAMGVNFRIQALVHPTAALNPEACREEIDMCLDAGADILCPAFAISRLQLQARRVDGWPARSPARRPSTAPARRSSTARNRAPT